MTTGPTCPGFVSEVYGLPATPEQLARVAEACRAAREVRWQVFQGTDGRAIGCRST